MLNEPKDNLGNKFNDDSAYIQRYRNTSTYTPEHESKDDTKRTELNYIINKLYCNILPIKIDMKITKHFIHDK